MVTDGLAQPPLVKTLSLDFCVSGPAEIRLSFWRPKLTNTQVAVLRESKAPSEQPLNPEYLLSYHYTHNGSRTGCYL